MHHHSTALDATLAHLDDTIAKLTGLRDRLADSDEGLERAKRLHPSSAARFASSLHPPR